MIDSAFADQAHLSPDFVAAARRQVQGSDVVVFSHPWVYPLVRDVIDPERQLVVYDAHNVEGLLRMRLLDDHGGVGTRVVRSVVRQEHELCHAADLVLACSHEDRLLFEGLYGLPSARMRVAPNGVFCDRILPASPEDKRTAREELGLGAARVVLFLGSAYAPNIEAARLVADRLAPAFPDVLFVVAGGVGEAFSDEDKARRANLRVTGLLSEEDKRCWLAASELAVNPMLSGSGTNIKMFDFMAAGLPVLTTPVGARGIEAGAEAVFERREPTDLARGLALLLGDARRRDRLGEAARRFVERFFDWGRISRQLGLLLARRHRAKLERRRPFFSVVVPSYERPDQLTRVAECLEAQTERDFEVIVIDQSAASWPDRKHQRGFDLLYVHSDIRGAVPARNLGAFLAQGEVIAFTDDDCEPCPDWLRATRPCFDEPDVVGVEGLIRCDAPPEPGWRVVTNDGWTGIGFMTANLFVRLGAFHRLNGFDIAFEKPFREDTDFGWRAQQLGRIPFSREACVYHPPQPRSVERESQAARDRYFVQDALLYRKHPSRFIDLIQREGHMHSNANYVRYLFEGLARYGVAPGRDLLAIIPHDKRIAALGF